MKGNGACLSRIYCGLPACGKRDEDTLTTLASRLAQLDRQISGKETETIEEISGGKSLLQLSAALLNACDPDKVEAASRRLSDSDEESRMIEMASYFDPLAPVEVSQANLPHWKQEGVTYFVTFRLVDSLPQEKLEQWRHERDEWLKRHPEPLSPDEEAEYHRIFSARIETWLDQDHGSCVLDIPECKDIMENALRYFDGQRYILGDFVIAPNHVHAILTPLPGHDLSDILHSWKSYTAKAIIKIARAQQGLKPFWDKLHFHRAEAAKVEAASRRLDPSDSTKVEAASRRLSSSSTTQGIQPQYQRPVWQKESYDHIIRSEASLLRIIAYVRGHSAWSKKRRDAASTLLERARVLLVNKACAPFDSPALRDAIMRAKQKSERITDAVTDNTIIEHDDKGAVKGK